MARVVAFLVSEDVHTRLQNAARYVVGAGEGDAGAVAAVCLERGLSVFASLDSSARREVCGGMKAKILAEGL